MTGVLVAISVACAVAAVRWPLPGLLAYLWLDFMRVQDYCVALRSGRPMLAIGIGLVIAALRSLRRQTASEALRDSLALAVLCLAVLPGIVLSEGASPLVAVLPIKLAVVSLLLARLVENPTDFDRVLIVIAASLSVLALDVIYQGYANGMFGQNVLTSLIEGPAGAGHGAYRDNNDLARALVFGLALAAAFTRLPSPRSGRVAAAIVVALLVEGVVISGSRGGFIALVCVGCYLIFSFLRPVRAVLTAVVLSVALFGLAMPETSTKRVQTIARLAEQSSVQSRVDIWRAGLRRAIEKPLFGHGLGTFAVPHAKGRGHTPRTAHNIFVELFYETGAVGLAAYLFVLLQAVWHLRRASVDADLAQWARARRIALEAAAVGFVVASLALSTAFQSIPFVIVGLMMALERTQQGGRRDTALCGEADCATKAGG